MTTRYFIDDAGRFVGAFGEGAEPPAGVIEVEAPPPIHADQPWIFPGWGPSLSEATGIEEKWRTAEMPSALETVQTVMLGAGEVAGTLEQWKDYWLALRDWKDGNPDYPDMSKRPVRPS